MTEKNVMLEIEEEIAVIKINRPQALNALNYDMILDLEQILIDLEKDSTVRAVIITGGKHFAAGADISGMTELSPDEVRAHSFRHCFNRIENFPKPVIAVISGFALGGGLEMALACDLRIGDKTAKLGLPEINLGLLPGAGGTIRLPRLIGAGRAKELIFSGAPIDAEVALQYGLLNKIADDPLAEAKKVARMLASKPPISLKMAKQCVNMAFDVEGVKAIEFESVAFAYCFATEDRREGVKAFAEKRAPKFTGK